MALRKKLSLFSAKAPDDSATFLVRDRHIILFNESIEALKKSLFILKIGREFGDCSGRVKNITKLS